MKIPKKIKKTEIFWVRSRAALPNSDIEVIVYDDAVGQVTVGSYNGAEWRCPGVVEDKDIYLDITHWAFMPKEP